MLPIIIIPNFILDTYRLGHKSFFVDEVTTFVKTTDWSMRHIILGPFALYRFLVYYWIRLFPINEFAVRIPFLVFSGLSILAVYILVRELFNSKKTALTASLTTAAAGSTCGLHTMNQMKRWRILLQPISTANRIS